MSGRCRSGFVDSFSSLAGAAHSQVPHVLIEERGLSLEADPLTDMPDHAGRAVVNVKHRPKTLAPFESPRLRFHEPWPDRFVRFGRALRCRCSAGRGSMGAYGQYDGLIDILSTAE